MSPPSEPTSIDVIVVAYRADAHLDACLRTLGAGVDITVVDNDASPETGALVDANGARYLVTDRNVGFAAAVNLALSRARDGRRDVLLLNPDARIGMSEVLALQSELRSEPRVAAIGPSLVDESGLHQRADWPLPSPGQVWADALGLARWWRGPRFVVGAVLLLRAEALAVLGGFDERFFLYAEEADWQLRAQRADWGVVVSKIVTATHVGAASSPDPTIREMYFHTSGAAFAQKWYGRGGWRLMWLGSVVAAGRRSLVGSAPSRAQNRRTVRIYLGWLSRVHGVVAPEKAA